MEEQSDLLTQFIAITGANDERARFFLESSAWKLEIAMERYYENEGDDDDVEEVAGAPLATPETTPKPPSSAVPVAARPARPTSARFATLNTLTNSSDEEEEGQQAFYAGGSEHSGQQVLGPPSKNRDFVAGMFKSVQEHGVEILESGAAGGSKLFKGTGYKLGQGSDDSVVIAGSSEPPPPPEVTLKLWRDGFSVNEGDVRAYTDPANRDFLESIRRGEIPEELRQGTTEVHLAMEDHRMEGFKQSAHKVTRPFAGQGYTLGSPAPPVIGSCLDEDKPVNEARAKENVKIDASKPTTSLQIRLADGSRLVGQFNHSHTVADVRQFILAARPQYEMASFNLLSSYPSKVLDNAQSLEEAGLLNAAIMQKLT